MTPKKPTNHDPGPGERPAPRLEDLLPIAAVVGAGCERCAEAMTWRALRRGTPRPLIDATLRIVEQVCSAECLAAAVGSEVITRMEKALQAGKKASRQADLSTEDRDCRG